MRVRVQIDPWLPLFVGFMLNLDDGTKQWIQCRYDRVFKVCTKCGLIGHKRTQCPISQEEIEYMIHRQRMRLEQNFHVQFDFDVCERPQTWGSLKKEIWALFRAHLFLSK